MKSKLFILILAILLCSCAPGQLPAAPTLPPTATPIPSATATATLIPTETSTPTAVPIPQNEYQVTDADGNLLIVVGDQLFKWENGKQIPIEIENAVFENAIDAANAAKALAPPEYFEGDQQALKDILLPDGVSVHWKIKAAMEMAGGNYNGVIAIDVYGVPVAVDRVKANPEDNYDLVILNVAIMGLDQPVPVIVGKYQNGKFYQLTSNATFDYSQDPTNVQIVRDDVEQMEDLNAVKALIGKAVLVAGVVGFNPSLYQRDELGMSPDMANFREKILNRLDELLRITAEKNGPVENPDSLKFKKASEMLSWFLKDWFNRGLDFDGFLATSMIKIITDK